MKTSTIAFLLAVVVGTGTLTTQAQSSGESDSLKRLRQIIAEQKQNPDKVIRDPTNPPSAQVTNAAPTQKMAPPLRHPLEFKPAPPAEPPTGKKAAAAELERQFLNGKISAKKYQKALAELDNPSKAPAVQPPTDPKPAPAVTTTPPKPPPDQGVAASTAPPQPPTEYKRVSEVETKIDDMIRQKQARESAAKTNAPPAPSAPLTKRQRLDFLLRQVIDGKLSDAEYKKEREKILAEPE